MRKGGNRDIDREIATHTLKIKIKDLKKYNATGKFEVMQNVPPSPTLTHTCTNVRQSLQPVPLEAGARKHKKNDTDARYRQRAGPRYASSLRCLFDLDFIHLIATKTAIKHSLSKPRIFLSCQLGLLLFVHCGKI